MMSKLTYRLAAISVVLVALLGPPVYLILQAPSSVAPLPVDRTNPDTVLKHLAAGNARFTGGQRTLSANSRMDAPRRQALLEKEQPFAVIFCDTDSRVNPTLVFDQLPGALQEVRSPGLIVDSRALGELEDAVERHGIHVILVVGQYPCPVIAQVLDPGGQKVPSYLQGLKTEISEINSSLLPLEEGHLRYLTEENVRRQAARLTADSSLLRQAVAEKRLEILPGLIDLARGLYYPLPARAIR